MAIALIFSRYLVDNQRNVRGLDLLILRNLRWLVLLLAIGFFLSTPLIISDTVRVYRTIHQQVSIEDASKLAQIQQIEQQLDQVSNLQLAQAIGQSIGLEAQSLQNLPLSALKETIQNQLSTIQTSLESQIKTNQKEQSQKLIKSSIRTLYAGFIMSMTFILIWSNTGRMLRYWS